MLNARPDTTKHLYWNARDKCYVALMSEVPMCRAEGATPAEALENVERAYAQGNYHQMVRPIMAAGSRISGYMATR